MRKQSKTQIQRITQREPQLQAIEKNDREALKVYLENGGDPNFCAKQDRSLLNLAIDNDAAWAVKLLVKHKVWLNKKDYNGLTPLLYYLRKGNKGNTILSILLDGGADPNVASIYGEMPLVEAVGSTSITRTKLLMTHGAKPEIAWKQHQSPWQNASNERSFNLLLDININPEYTTQLQKNALHYAALRGLDRIVKKLIKTYKLDPNSQDHEGKTALMVAVETGNIKTCKTLMALGADIQQTNLAGQDAKSLIQRINHKSDEDYELLKHMMALEYMNVMKTYLSKGKRTVKIKRKTPGF